MKMKITLFLMLVVQFISSSLQAQTVSGTATNTGCLSSGIVNVSSVGLGATPQYQLLKAGVVVKPVPGDATQFASVSSFTNLGTGTYTVKGKDSNSLTVYSSPNIIVSDGYTTMTTTTPSRRVQCTTSTVGLVTTVVGGKGPYKYDISLQSNPAVVVKSSGFITATSYTFAAMSIESYVTSVTDACGQTITGATSVTIGATTIAQVQPGRLNLRRSTRGNCALPVQIEARYGFTTCGGNSCAVPNEDKEFFSWRLEFNGLSYGNDIDGDGFPDLAGPNFSVDIRTVSMPGGITDGVLAAAGNPKYVVYDSCGNTKSFSPTQERAALSAVVCGTTAVVNFGPSELNTFCYPFNFTFTSTTNPIDVITYTSPDNNVAVIPGFTSGKTYTIAYTDGAGRTTGMFGGSTIAIPSAANPFSLARWSGIGFPANAAERPLFNVSFADPGTVITTTILSSTVAGYTGFTTTNIVNGPGIITPSAPFGLNYYPAGTYTMLLEGPCGSYTVTRTVSGYNGSISSVSTSPICGGFNAVVNIAGLTSTAGSEVIIVSGPSNVGAVRSLTSTTTSDVFSALSLGTYTFGLRSNSTSPVVSLFTVNMTAGNAIVSNAAGTGGFVCNATDTNGVLTIAATSNNAAPNDVLSYAISLDGGATFSAYQSGNTFGGLSSGEYQYRVQDGCGNVITQTGRISLVSSANIVVNGLADGIKRVVCNTPNTPIPFSTNVNVPGSTYTWSGPGITAANQNSVNPTINTNDLTLGDNSFTLTVVLGAPCNTVIPKSFIVTLAAVPTATIAYSSASFCNVGTATVTQTGTTGGTYSSTAGLSINATTGAINLATSLTGTFVVTYSFVSGTCTNTTTTSVNINPTPSLVITNPAAVCAPNKVNLTAFAVTAGSSGGVTFTYFTDAAATITLANPSAVASSGTYYIKASNANCSIIAPVTVVVNALPIATISYSSTPYCNRGTATATQTGATGGTYSSDVNLSINASTGLIDLAASTAGNHVVTYSFTNGTCPSTATTTITINATTLPSSLADVTAQCTVSLTAPQLTDVCAGTITATTATTFPITTQGTTVVTWTFDYGNGFNKTTTQNVIIDDTVAPVKPTLSDVNGQCSVTLAAPTTTDACKGIITGTTTTTFPIATVGTTVVTWTFDDGNGNSITSDQNVIITNVTLAGTPATSCASDGSGYTLSLSVSGEGPFTATGTGAPGTWTGNSWVSNKILAGVNYNVSIKDVNACNTLVVTDTAPVCCVFAVTCPTFPATTVACYTAIPTATSLTEAQFEALGNGDGVIGDIPCGVIEITASNAVSPACEGNVIRTYTVTEYDDTNKNKVRDAGENTVLKTQDCMQTYTIERLDFTMPANGALTVACAAAIVTPTVPVVKDNCGNTLTPSAAVISTTPTCEGDVTYTYKFTDCEGNTHDWVYTYTIERLDFTMPANGALTVACAAAIVTPTVPVVKDNCGNTLTPSAAVISTTPTCEGDVTYTYKFTDCEGNTHDWVYTYTIERLDFTMPANGALTVACAAAIVTPTVPVVKDNCGNTLTPSAAVISTTPTCEGDVTYTYKFTDCEGNTHDWVYTYTIERLDFTMPANGALTVACAAAIVTPTVPVVKDNCGNTLTPSAAVISTTPTCEGDVTYTYKFTDCEGNTHDWVYTYTIERLDFTMPANGALTVACAAAIVTPTVPVVKDNCGNTLTPSAAVISTTPTCEGDVTYTYKFTDCEGNTHDWVYTYTIERLDFTMPANGALTVACAAAIVTPTVPVVKDNCGNTLTPSAAVISTTPTCEGDVTYTYKFTDCEGNTHDWVYTYTIERLDFTMPANGALTVACAAAIVTPTVPVVKDNCGNTLTPSAAVISTTPTCEGDVTYTYKFTDCEGNTHDWVYTYTIERLDFTMPANGALTVACAAAIVTPTVPVVKDNCGNTLTPSAAVISTTPTCEGDVTYTYKFTDCEGNTHDWVYTYTIERLDFTMPANGALTVACAAAIVTPTVPVVKDNCGNTLTPSAAVISTTPTCEGDVTYTYKFTDCEGNTHDWVYTYTIERLDFTMPANGALTVACAAAIVTPTVPVVKDNCGNTLTPSAAVISTTPTCEGDVTYTYKFTDCEGNTHDWVYTYTIERLDFTMPANGALTVACAAAIVTPTVPVVKDNCGNTLTPSAAVISTTPTCEGDVTYTYKFTDCEGNTHDWVYTYTIERLDFTMPANGALTVACAAAIVTPTVPVVKDNCGNTLTPSAAVISTTPTCEGDVTYTYKFTDCEGNTHDWVYTYTIERLDFTMPANGALTVACAAAIVTPTVPVVKDNCGNTLTPSAAVISTTPTCEGDVTYTYKFTDCEGNTHDWVYTYTIERLDFTMPANGALTVACAAAIVTPTVPVVKDNCGNTLTPSAAVISTTPTCEGDVTYTYKFTDCEGNTHDWVYTYTIERLDFTMPANGALTVACAAAIVTPTVPVVKDNCGNTLTPSAAVISTTPTCEGDVTYTYKFTDCEGNTHDWVYTYTIERLDFTMPANGALTVACAAAIVTPTVPVVKDNCGNTLTPSAAVISTTPTCEGDVTYTYKFTDCEGNTHDWIYTYTVKNLIAPTATAPSNLTLQCVGDIPVANINMLTNVKGNCAGSVLVTVSDSNNGGRGCQADPYILTRKFTLVDCGGLSSTYVQMITVLDNTAPVLSSPLARSITVSCDQIPSVASLSFADNCSRIDQIKVTFTETATAPNAGMYAITRKWIATDSCNNSNTIVQVINVVIKDYLIEITKQACSRDEATIDLNSLIPVKYLGKGSWTETNSSGNLKGAIFYPSRLLDGNYVLEYYINHKDCPQTIKVTVNVTKECEVLSEIECVLKPFKGVSPNGDGVNDSFVIENIECYPDNVVEIYNRWGVLVYERKGYNNTDRPFIGFSEGRATFNQSEELPVGTYYYIFKYVDRKNNNKEKSGYLYISR
jgi:gliding motility-associated-like protein